MLTLWPPASMVRIGVSVVELAISFWIVAWMSAAVTSTAGFGVTLACGSASTNANTPRIFAIVFLLLVARVGGQSYPFNLRPSTPGKTSLIHSAGCTVSALICAKHTAAPHSCQGRRGAGRSWPQGAFVFLPEGDAVAVEPLEQRHDDAAAAAQHLPQLAHRGWAVLAEESAD